MLLGSAMSDACMRLPLPGKSVPACPTPLHTFSACIHAKWLSSWAWALTPYVTAGRDKCGTSGSVNSVEEPARVTCWHNDLMLMLHAALLQLCVCAMPGKLSQLTVEVWQQTASRSTKCKGTALVETAEAAGRVLTVVQVELVWSGGIDHV